LAAAAQADDWVITCTDNGISIEPQYAERIFIIFQRLHSKSSYSGTGIGLALCRKIIEFHGGRIWLDTQEPVASGGSRFVLTLPHIQPVADGADDDQNRAPITKQVDTEAGRATPAGPGADSETGTDAEVEPATNAGPPASAPTAGVRGR
jgi:hypothetical protein